MSMPDFLARARKAANDKARELGWRYANPMPSASNSELAAFPFRLFGFGSTFHHIAFSFGHARALRDRTLPSVF
jgi:hypothetical protein